MSETPDTLQLVQSVKVVYRVDGPEPFYWANTYETTSEGILVPDLQAYDNLAAAMAGVLVNLLLSDYLIDRIIVGTYAPDGDPYNPNNFTVRQVNERGVRNSAGINLPLTNTLVCRRNALAGRDGFLLLRGFLTADDLFEVGGNVSLQPGIISNVNNGLAGLVTAIDGAGFNLVMARNPGLLTALVKPVSSITYQRLGVKQLRSPRKRSNVGTAALNLVEELVEVGLAGEIINPLIGAFNALPLNDIPLLP